MKTLFGSLSALCLLGIISCGDMNPSSPAINKGQELPSIIGMSLSDTYAGFTAYRSTIKLTQGTVIQDIATASLWNGSGMEVDGGTVTLNGVNLEKTIYNGTGCSYSNLDNDGTGNPNNVPLIFDGSYHKFVVTGSSAFAALIDSVASPTADLNVTFPLPSSTVSKSSGFTVTWNAIGADTAQVVIFDSVTTVGHVIFSKMVSDNGSLTISSNDLSTLSTGPIEVTVTRGNYKIATDASNRAYVLAVYSAQSINTTLTP